MTSSPAAKPDKKPLTGRTVWVIALCSFGVVLAANLSLVYAALGTFPGLEVKNSYVASQVFDAQRTAQLGLGWTVLPTFDGKSLQVEIKDKAGAEVTVRKLDVIVGRATTDAQDVPLNFAQTTGPYVAAVTLAPGKWEVRLKAIALDGTAFHQRLEIHVN